ncbi:uncharacterized protein K02A2.6-like [Lucilia cuprina]|uniref:uncharacterized protein K02A2.6-like n=1 Tax=Lucilia cuprina TaxID=7375 RepID=UPI001F0703F1|nr:uncharacterized protein K02A2.6-like [Lucilia cuprina]
MPSEKRLDAIRLMPQPKNLKEVEAFIDALSRLPMGEDIEFDNYEKSMLDIENIYESTIADFPIDAHIIAEHTKNDNILKSVSKYITEGWPENIQKSQKAGSNPNREFSSWPEATKPWERIHVDFAGPFFSQMWLIVVDSYSRFPYVIEISTATSSTTINALQDIFSVEGLPNTTVSDNGSQFTSKDFEEFCRRNAIEHITSPPFHPSSNGLAERTVRTFKESFKKNMCDKHDKSRAVFKFLSTYRSTPNTVTGKSPAELFHGRQPRTILSALFPSKHSKVENQTKFKVNDLVYARNFAGTKKWIEGTITNVEGK